MTQPPPQPDLEIDGLPPLVLRATGRALPADAARAVAELLSRGVLDNPSAELEQLRETITAESFTQFVWGIFNAWLDGGGHSKHMWALDTLAILGTEETVMQLVACIRKWPRQSKRTHANRGLDVLMAMGTHTSLTAVDELARTATDPGTRRRARKLMSQVAHNGEALFDTIVDRLVPTLGLSEAGTTCVSYGQRQFTVGFGAGLCEYVYDNNGHQVPVLPDVDKGDDRLLATEAINRWATLTARAESIAQSQVHRFESAMVTQRRWSFEDFDRFIVQHPIVTHLAQGLVWGTYANGELVDAFRITADRAFANASDEPFQLRGIGDIHIGIVHPIQLEPVADSNSATLEREPSEQHALWNSVFADYEILQPFAQLQRPAFAMNDTLRKQTTYVPANPNVLESSVLALLYQGWEAATWRPRGVVSTYFKRIEPNARPGSTEHSRSVAITYSPGVEIGYEDGSAIQRIEAVFFTRYVEDRSESARLPFGQLDPVEFSELLKTLAELTG